MPCSTNTLDGVPVVHSPTAHGVFVVGVLLSSTTVIVPPLPSHATAWQALPTWSGTGVPAAAATVTHLSFWHENVSHVPAEPVQSPSDRHCGLVMSSLQDRASATSATTVRRTVPIHPVSSDGMVVRLQDCKTQLETCRARYGEGV